ncbi:MAG: transferrin-binding protein-like solute binding protein [Cardiobacteriaceae bacterium]|nr:transferrin-binding protein-like solute binding protein [Cardiobacteriaceae bacterium]
MQNRIVPLSLTITALLLAACGGNGGQPPLPEQPQTPYVPHDNHGGNNTQQPKKEEQKQDTSKPAPAPSPSPNPSPTPNPPSPINPTPTPPSTTQPRPLNIQEIQSAVVNPSSISHLQSRIKIGTSDGKLSLGTPDFNGSSHGDPGTDAGMNALKDGEAGVNPAFGGVSGYYGQETAIFLRSLSATKWSYQTFGQVAGHGGSLGYASIGKPFIPDDNATLKASYQGIAMGTYDNTSEVISDMKAELDWSNKTLSIQIDNSKIAPNSAAIAYQGIQNDARFDFNETLNWSSTNQRFESATTHGHLYGADAAEVGGTWGKTVDGKVYNGAFGGKKQ